MLIGIMIAGAFWGSGLTDDIVKKLVGNSEQRHWLRYSLVGFFVGY